MSVAYAEAYAAGWERERTLTVSEWADRYRVLSTMSTAEPGNWRTSRTPYLKDIMDALSSRSPAQRIVVMAGAQVGKTECGSNWIGYVIHRNPGPMLMVQPTVEVAKRVSKQRIAPMISATPVLSERVKEPRARDSGNTVQVKEFAGGLLILTGANSGAGLRSMPIRFLFMDEIDEYPGDVDDQGDPVALAEKRTSTFGSRRKILLTSTPTIRGLSRIEREFMASDRRYYYVPCPACGNMDWIRWENIRWEPNDPLSAKLACVACGGLISEAHKTAMLAHGEWRATAESTAAGFHISALYSPVGWVPWSKCVAEYLSSKEDPFRLKTWVNTVLGETWEERGDSADPDSLKARIEEQPAEVPNGVGCLVAAIDVQIDRLEVLVKGFGAAEESWQIDFSQIHGDPSSAAPWYDLDKLLGREFVHASGRKVRIDLAVIDSGGAHTEQVYRYCRSRLGGFIEWPGVGNAQMTDWKPGRFRVFPIKGGSVTGNPLVQRPTNRNRYAVPLFVLCVDTGKEAVMSRLLIKTPSPGYIHLLDREWLDDEYLAQLTAEKAIRKYVKGRGAVREWVKLRERNEAFDLEVYALAALYILGAAFIRTLPERAAAWAAPVASAPAGQPAAPRKRSGWVGGWR